MRTGEQLLTQSLELARRLDDPVAFATAAGYIVGFRVAPQHNAERVSIADELWSSTKRSG